MSQPHARFLLPDGTEAPVGPGGLIGRMITAALTIDHPRVSEAHAMVSLRGGELHLIALRGHLEVGRRSVVRVALHPGMRIELVPGLTLTVSELVLPETVLALGWAGQPPIPLAASAYTLDLEPEIRLEPGFSEASWANLWATAAEGWRVRIQGQEPRRLVAGDVLEHGGRAVLAVAVPAAAAAVAPTLAAATGEHPLTVVLRHDTVHVHGGGVSVHIVGIPARILTELGTLGAPVPWELVARTIWKDEPDRFVMRQNWDRHLKGLRARLREAGVRADLARADGLGNIELFLRPEDRLVDES